MTTDRGHEKRSVARHASSYSERYRDSAVNNTFTDAEITTGKAIIASWLRCRAVHDAIVVGVVSGLLVSAVLGVLTWLWTHGYFVFGMRS